MANILTQYVAIGLAGSAGAMLRFFVSGACVRLFGPAFPVGTFVVNVSGSLFLGWCLVAIHDRGMLSDTFRLAIAVGFVGAYTTFSTFAYESNLLLGEGAGIRAAVNMLGSLAAGLAAVRLGMWLGTRA